MSRNREPRSLTVLLRIPVFRRLWGAITLSSLGDWLGLLATTALAAYLTRDTTNLVQGAAISGVLVTRLLPDLLLAPVAGAFVDRFDRRIVAIVCDTLAGLLYLSIALVGNLSWLLAAQFLAEAVGLFSTPAKQAIWVNIVPRERLAVANQLNYVSIYGMVPVAALVFALLSTTAQFFGAPATAQAAAGTLIAGPTSAVAINIALIIDAGTYLVSAAVLLVSREMIPAFVGERNATASVFRLVAEGIGFVKNNRLMRALYVGILGAFGAGGLVAGVAQTYVGALGAGNAGYSILFGSVFTGLALGMLIGPRVLPNMPRRMIFSSTIGAAGIVLVVMALLQDFVGAAVASVVMGMFAGIAWITGFTLIGHEVSDHLRGRVFAFVMSSVRLTLLATIAAGPVLAGAIGSHYVSVGNFNWAISGPALVLACGGVVAFGVSLFAGHQVGGLTRGAWQRLLRRQQRSLIREESALPGALITVEGADPALVAVAAETVIQHVRELAPVACHAFALDEQATTEPTTPDAFRVVADLAQFVAGTVRPELEAGSVVVCRGYIDTAVVRFGTVDGLDDDRVARMALWATGELQPVLTVLVDTPSAGLLVTSTPDAPAHPTVAADQGVSAGSEERAAGHGAPNAWSADDTDAAQPENAGEQPAAVADPAAGTGPAGAAADADPEPGTVVKPDMPGGGRGRVADTPAVDPADAYRERAALAPERYLIVRPAGHGFELTAEQAERIDSVLRERHLLGAHARV